MRASKKFKRLCSALAREIEQDSYLTALVDAINEPFSTPPNAEEIRCFMSLQDEVH